MWGFYFSSVKIILYLPGIVVSTAKVAWDKLEQEFKGLEKVIAIRLKDLGWEFENLKVVDVVNHLKLNGDKKVTISIEHIKCFANLSLTKFTGVSLAYEQRKSESSIEEAFTVKHKQ